MSSLVHIFFLSSFLPLVFHSLTESLNRPCNYRQTVLIDRGGNDTGVMGKLWNMKSERSIWLWDGGKGGWLFSQRMSCCGQVVDRASGQLIDPLMWPADGSETRHGGLPVVRPLAGMPVLHHCQTRLSILTWQWWTALPKCASVCVLLSLLRVGMFVRILAPAPGSPSLPLSPEEDWFWLGHCLATDAFWLMSTVSSRWSAVIMHNGDGTSPVGVRRKHIHGSYQLDWWFSFCLHFPSVSFKLSVSLFQI